MANNPSKPPIGPLTNENNFFPPIRFHQRQLSTSNRTRDHQRHRQIVHMSLYADLYLIDQANDGSLPSKKEKNGEQKTMLQNEQKPVEYYIFPYQSQQTGMPLCKEQLLKHYRNTGNDQDDEKDDKKISKNIFYGENSSKHNERQQNLRNIYQRSRKSQQKLPKIRRFDNLIAELPNSVKFTKDLEAAIASTSRSNESGEVNGVSLLTYSPYLAEVGDEESIVGEKDIKYRQVQKDQSLSVYYPIRIVFIKRYPLKQLYECLECRLYRKIRFLYDYRNFPDPPSLVATMNHQQPNFISIEEWAQTANITLNYHNNEDFNQFYYGQCSNQIHYNQCSNQIHYNQCSNQIHYNQVHSEKINQIHYNQCSNQAQCSNQVYSNQCSNQVYSQNINQVRYNLGLNQVHSEKINQGVNHGVSQGINHGVGQGFNQGKNQNMNGGLVTQGFNQAMNGGLVNQAMIPEPTPRAMTEVVNQIYNQNDTNFNQNQMNSVNLGQNQMNSVNLGQNQMSLVNFNQNQTNFNQNQVNLGQNQTNFNQNQVNLGQNQTNDSIHIVPLDYNYPFTLQTQNHCQNQQFQQFPQQIFELSSANGCFPNTDADAAVEEGSGSPTGCSPTFDPIAEGSDSPTGMLPSVFPTTEGSGRSDSPTGCSPTFDPVVLDSSSSTPDFLPDLTPCRSSPQLSLQDLNQPLPVLQLPNNNSCSIDTMTNFQKNNYIQNNNFQNNFNNNFQQQNNNNFNNLNEFSLGISLNQQYNNTLNHNLANFNQFQQYQQHQQQYQQPHQQQWQHHPHQQHPHQQQQQQQHHPHQQQHHHPHQQQQHQQQHHQNQQTTCVVDSLDRPNYIHYIQQTHQNNYILERHQRRQMYYKDQYYRYQANKIRQNVYPTNPILDLYNSYIELVSLNSTYKDRNEMDIEFSTRYKRQRRDLIIEYKIQHNEMRAHHYLEFDEDELSSLEYIKKDTLRLKSNKLQIQSHHTNRISSNFYYEKKISDTSKILKYEKKCFKIISFLKAKEAIWVNNNLSNFGFFKKFQQKYNFYTLPLRSWPPFSSSQSYIVCPLKELPSPSLLSRFSEEGLPLLNLTFSSYPQTPPSSLPLNRQFKKLKPSQGRRAVIRHKSLSQHQHQQTNGYPHTDIRPHTVRTNVHTLPHTDTCPHTDVYPHINIGNSVQETTVIDDRDSDYYHGYTQETIIDNNCYCNYPQCTILSEYKCDYSQGTDNCCFNFDWNNNESIFNPETAGSDTIIATPTTIALPITPSITTTTTTTTTTTSSSSTIATNTTTPYIATATTTTTNPTQSLHIPTSTSDITDNQIYSHQTNQTHQAHHFITSIPICP